jgi:hypothetical protein
MGVWALAAAAGLGPVAVAGDDAPKIKLIPVDLEVIAAREKELAAAAPEGARLVAYLDCGCQEKSATTDRVTIAFQRGKPYRFGSEAKEVLPTQRTVFFDESQVAFQLSGLDRAGRYLAGLTWWDYDDGGRTQSVVIGSPDGRRVRLAVTAIRLPNYTSDGQPPAERRFSLPATFSQNGQMQLTIHHVTGANAVISELWIWELD